LNHESLDDLLQAILACLIEEQNGMTTMAEPATTDLAESERNHRTSWRRTVTELYTYPTELDAHLTLTDQRRVLIRALHRGEERPIRVLHARLSPRTRYLRFLSPMPTLPDALVRQLACVDYRRRLAVVAEDEGAGCTGVVALASVGAVGETTAEVAIVVQDDWQRQGVGTAVVSKLLDAAEKRGFERFVATIAADNSIILRLLDRVGRVVASHTSFGVTELAFVRR
jgi:RimJ/RimL family protein N-acetyltransferase